MTPMQLLYLAYAVSIGLLWGYAIYLLVHGRKLHNRRSHSNHS